MNEEYRDYLMSAEWQRKRSERLKIDNYKCQKCGSPLRLQVHHLNYDNIFHEDVHSDLITLCDNCHKEIEQNKKAYKTPVSMPDLCQILSIRISEAAWQNHNRHVKQFIKDYSKEDYSAGGEIDLCQVNVIKSCLTPYLKERFGDEEEGGSGMVQRHFRNERYKIILEYLDKDYPMGEVVKRTRFSYNMISKVYKNPETARRLIKEEI